MTLGRGIFLMAFGLILALGIRDEAAFFDLDVIGWIFTGVGMLVFILSFVVGPNRQAAEPEAYEEHDDLGEV